MTTITLTDPHHVDGDPHEVARHAGDQLLIALSAASEGIDNLRWAARSAWMTAEEHRTGDMPKSWFFDATPQGKRLAALYDALQDIASETRLLTLAASYDPRAPVGKHDD